MQLHLLALRDKGHFHRHELQPLNGDDVRYQNCAGFDANIPGISCYVHIMNVKLLNAFLFSYYTSRFPFLKVWVSFH